MKKVKRTAQKLKEEYEDIADGKKCPLGSYSKKTHEKIKKVAKKKVKEMEKFLKNED